MPVASLLVSTRRLLLDVGAVHTRGHRVIGEAGLVTVSDIPSLVISRHKDNLKCLLMSLVSHLGLAGCIDEEVCELSYDVGRCHQTQLVHLAHTQVPHLQGNSNCI